MFQYTFVIMLLIIGCLAMEPPRNTKLRSKFEKWKTQYRKIYFSDDEENRRFTIFTENLQRMEAMAKQTGAIYGPDKFSDIPHKEFIAQYTCGQTILGDENPEGALILDPVSIKTMKDVKAYDWRDHGAVSSVKNQGAYGTCWSFGAAGALEGMSVLAGNKIQNVSSQELIDCCDNCQGRSTDISFYWLMNNTNGYIDTMESYPYGGKRTKCKKSNATLSKAKVASTIKIHDVDNQDKIMTAMLQHGPGAVGVDATCLNGYKGGVINNCPGEGCDHSVLLVGVGSDKGLDYFIIKNSWGAKWGEHGFFRVAKGAQQMSLSAAHFALSA